MSETHIIIPEGEQVTFDEVMQTLAANGGTGMTSADASTLFTEEANINPDSKKKPIVLADYFPGRTAEWWKGADGLCGFNLDNARHAGTAETLSDLESAIDGGRNGWRHILPSGGAASPYRIADFEGYSTTAKMVPSFIIPSSAGNAMGATLKVAMALPIENDHTLALSDLTPLASYYFGAIMAKGTNIVARTSDKPITESLDVEISTEGLAAGTWHVWPFLSQNTILSDADHGKVGIFYTIPDTAAQDVVISNTDPVVFIRAQKESPLTVNVTLTVTNPQQNSLSFSANSIQLRYGSSDISDPLLSGEQSVAIEDFTVAAGGSHTVTHSFEFLDALLYNNCKVWVILNAGTITRSVYPAEDIEV